MSTTSLSPSLSLSLFSLSLSLWLDQSHHFNPLFTPAPTCLSPHVPLKSPSRHKVFFSYMSAAAHMCCCWAAAVSLNFPLHLSFNLLDCILSSTVTTYIRDKASIKWLLSVLLFSRQNKMWNSTIVKGNVFKFYWTWNKLEINLLNLVHVCYHNLK